MMPDPIDTATADYLRRQAHQVLEQSQHLFQTLQQVQHEACRTRAKARRTCDEARLARLRSCERRRRDQHLRALSARPAASASRPHPETLDNLVLVERCKAGEARAWNELVRRHERLIFSFARSPCDNAADAADVTSEVFLRLYVNLHTFRRGATSFKAWLFKIIHNTYVDVCIRDSNHGHLSLDAPINPDSPADTHVIVDPTPTPEALCLDKDRLKRLAEGIRTLPAYQREVLDLFLQGFSYEQIAEETGLSMGTVKSRLNRARKTLQERLEAEERQPARTLARRFA